MHRGVFPKVPCPRPRVFWAPGRAILATSNPPRATGKGKPTFREWRSNYWRISISRDSASFGGSVAPFQRDRAVIEAFARVPLGFGKASDCINPGTRTLDPRVQALRGHAMSPAVITVVTPGTTHPSFPRWRAIPPRRANPPRKPSTSLRTPTEACRPQSPDSSRPLSAS
jgi:hypothetical protein